MRIQKTSKVLVGDLNTDFEKLTVNREVFQNILLENRGQRLLNDMWTYRKGNHESNIDHALLFANSGELDNIGHYVLREVFSDHLPLLSTF